MPDVGSAPSLFAKKIKSRCWRSWSSFYQGIVAAVPESSLLRNRDRPCILTVSCFLAMATRLLPQTDIVSGSDVVPIGYTDEMPISSVHGDFIYLGNGGRQREYTWDRENLVYRQRLRTRYVEDHWTPRHGILWRLVGVAIHGIGFIELTWQGQVVSNDTSPISSPLPSSD